MYKPLPNNVAIQPSEIEGVGLFAVEDIPAHSNLGISHHFLDDKLIRTPLGGFYNHSDDPNCYTVINNDYAELITLQEVSLERSLQPLTALTP